jgi:hypothetical protein
MKTEQEKDAEKEKIGSFCSSIEKRKFIQQTEERSFHALLFVIPRRIHISTTPAVADTTSVTYTMVKKTVYDADEMFK